MTLKVNGTIKRYGWWLLPLGAVLIFLTHMRYGIGFFAWFAYVPFLLFLRTKNGFLPRLALYGTSFAAWSVAIFKIITPPLEFYFSFGFAIIIATLHFAGFIAWDLLKERRFGFLVFPAAMVIMEYIQYTHTPFASWGAAAYTQIDSMIILQSVSLFGMAGLGFLIYLMNILITDWISGTRPVKLTAATAVILLIVIGFGHLRPGLGEGSSREMVRVAAIGTDSRVGGFPMPPDGERQSVREKLYERTKKVAESGARLVVWTEASCGILKDEEGEFTGRVRALGKELAMDIVAAYVVPVAGEKKYENKYIWVRPDGSVHHAYFKHEPVAGEPAVTGSEPPVAVDAGYAVLGGAICYDYDYPYLARGNATLGVDIAALPSSDWRGIDPIHTGMAALRAIESGHSIVRSTRFGLSAVIDPYGRVMGKMSHFDKNDKILLAHAPTRGVWTLYSVIGDSFIVLCVLLIIGAAVIRKKIAVISGGSTGQR